MTEQLQATILIVDEDEQTAAFLADNLTADGYELDLARSPGQALHALANKFPDLAIIDADLSGPSGLEIISTVRAADGVVSKINPRTPLMLLSSRSSELDRVRAFDRGADDFVAK